jgi:hypothetical protein
LLEQKNSQKGITFSSRSRKEKELFPYKSGREEKLRMDSALCAQRPCRGTEVKESLEDSKVKLRRNNAFSARSHSCKGRKGRRTLWRSSESIKLRRDGVFIRTGEDSSRRARRGKGAKIEAFENLKFFQVLEEKC